MNPLLHFLIGSWFVTYTNFPMWTKGDKTNPAFTYALITKQDGSEMLLDEVSYFKKGKKYLIKGYDHPDKKDLQAFTWKGKGLLSLLKSKWKVVLQDEAGQWAVIYFSKTLFTPKGVDIISKTSSFSEEQIKKIKVRMLNDSLLKEHIETLKQLNPEQ